MNADEQAIRNLVALWHRASAAADVDTVLGLMTDDVVFLVAGQPPMRGRDQFERGLRGLLTQHRIESTGSIEEVQVSGDWAWCWSQLTVKIIPLADGTPVTRSGSALSILHKSATGSWRVFRDANLLAVAP